MKQETYFKASEIQSQLNDVESLIIMMGILSNNVPITIALVNDSELEAFKTNMLNYLKNRKVKLKKEFDNLK